MLLSGIEGRLVDVSVDTGAQVAQQRVGAGYQVRDVLQEVVLLDGVVDELLPHPEPVPIDVDGLVLEQMSVEGALQVAGVAEGVYGSVGDEVGEEGNDEQDEGVVALLVALDVAHVGEREDGLLLVPASASGPRICLLLP